METDYQKMTSDERKAYHGHDNALDASAQQVTAAARKVRLQEEAEEAAATEARDKLDLFGCTIRGVTEFAWNAGVCPHCIATELELHATSIREAIDAGDTQECES